MLDLDSYSLRIFSQVMLDKTFSEAARSLKITQPSVSQQIAKLESSTGKLFQRVGHSLVPTPLALELHALSSRILEELDDFERKLQDNRGSPRGLVRYAMPESCQWTPHYKKIMGQLVQLPEVRFQIHILPNDKLVEELREGRLDFGFTVGERVSPELRFQKFSDEQYSAVCARRELFGALEGSRPLEELRLVTFPGWELFFSVWTAHHGLGSRFASKLKTPVVHIGTLAGAIHAIQEGAGVGIVPTHCVASELAGQELHEWCGKKKDRASNPIYLARRIGESLPKRVEMTLGLLTKAKQEL